MEKKNLTDEIIKALEFKSIIDAKIKYIDGTACKKVRVADILDLIRSLQSENDDLREENEAIRINCENARNITGQMFDKNDELQKQVDELKAENTELYKEHTTLIAGSILQKQQVQKDTAKEVLQMLHDIGGCDATDEWSKGWDKAIDTTYEAVKKRYGVEVE